MIENIRHIGIPVVFSIADMLHFYVEILGFKIVSQNTIKDSYGKDLTYIKLRLSDNPVLIELLYGSYSMYNCPMVPQHIAFTVEDINEVYKKLSRSGLNFISEPEKAQDSDCILCFCYDPSNNLIEFVEEPK
jgi:catechol 2,3-dioxygenase-like lactoylglutathione lyase family enzyme